MTRIADTMDRLTRTFVGVLLMALTADVLSGVFFRYFVRQPLAWDQEVAQFLMIWIAMLGAGPALRRGEHVGLTLLADVLSPRLLRWLRALWWVLIMYFLGFLAYGGGSLIPFSSRQDSTVVGYNLALRDLAIPVGAILMFGYALVNLVETLRRDDKREVGD